MTRCWENQLGVYDPVATEVIRNESRRNKEIHDTIQEIKNILGDKDLVLTNRIEIKDKLNNKTYK